MVIPSFVFISLSFIFASVHHAQAINIIPMERRTVVHRSPLHTRAPANLTNVLNSAYVVPMELGGKTFKLMIDTGSSDLWVTGEVPNIQPLGKSLTLKYAIGAASGNVTTAPLSFAGYNVSDQAFIHVVDTSTFSSNPRDHGYDGLVGFGPISSSVIFDELDTPASQPILDRIFQQNRTNQNYITILLDRQGDPTPSVSKGQMTVSEIIPGYEALSGQTKLAVDKIPGILDSQQHWQIWTDENGVIGPDGQPIKVDSIVLQAPKNKLMAVVDSGFTLTQVTRGMSDAIYGRVQGANYSEQYQAWTVPCNQYLPLSFLFGGQRIDIHPLDVVSDDFGLRDASGQKVCLGTFQPITSGFDLLGNYDLILGMSFMRNTYSLFDFGDFVEGTSSISSTSSPFIQMLSLTNATQAKQDFIQARCGGAGDCTNDPSRKLLPPEQMKRSPLAPGERKQHIEGKILRQWPYILLGCLLAFFIGVGALIWRCVKRRQRRIRREQQQMELGTAPYKEINNGSKTYLRG